jgi:hypothetical protein
MVISSTFKSFLFELVEELGQSDFEALRQLLDADELGENDLRPGWLLRSFGLFPFLLPPFSFIKEFLCEVWVEIEPAGTPSRNTASSCTRGSGWSGNLKRPVLLDFVETSSPVTLLATRCFPLAPVILCLIHKRSII